MREKTIAGNIYHVMNRGVDKRKIFLDDADYLRFIHDLFEFNDVMPKNNNFYYFKNKGFANHYNENEKEKKTLLVKIMVFCLMPNHYHLLLQPLSDNGLVQFVKKINIGYANYFNEKYQRKGALFEGRYKSIPVTKDAHFLHLPYYIHLNPLDLIMPQWRERKIDNYKKAIQFLENYRWSSFPDYIGKNNFPSVTQREFLNKFWGGSHNDYKKTLIDWLKKINLENVEIFE